MKIKNSWLESFLINIFSIIGIPLAAFYNLTKFIFLDVLGLRKLFERRE